MNDTERAQWIDNDEGLYDWWRGSRMPKAQFIKENRDEITRCIQRTVSGTRPAHYLKYGGSR